MFCGSAASSASARVGAYYAGPGNRFWQVLHESGLTPHLFAPEEFQELLSLGIGLTDLAKHEAGMDVALSSAAYDADALHVKVEAAAPTILAFTGKRPAGLFLLKTLGMSITDYGEQPVRLGGTRIFVLPSPPERRGGGGRPNRGIHWPPDIVNFGKSHEILRIRCRRCRRICRRHGRARIRRRIPRCPRRESVFTSGQWAEGNHPRRRIRCRRPCNRHSRRSGYPGRDFSDRQSPFPDHRRGSYATVDRPRHRSRSAQNGIPSGTFMPMVATWKGKHCKRSTQVRIASAIGNQRVIGCVITSSNIVEAPGVVRNIGNRVFALGEPDRTVAPSFRNCGSA